ncbi:MAG: hypothetical protein NT099_08480 [Candidatus Saganbacteria bacterium]|nr:hypothetical protein [Candidatus Saganbacteria bacterium]
MHTRKIGSILLLVVCLAVCLTACGNNKLESKGDNEVIGKNPNNPALADLNTKLGAIKDEDSAMVAVNTFTGHVLLRLDKNLPENQNLKISSVSESLRGKFARIEIKARQKLQGLSTVGASDEELVTSDKLAATLDKMQGENPNKIEVKPEQIESTQKVLRETMPNLASTDNTKMTPLEASILTYHMMTGDDGSDSPDILPLPATPQTIDQFAEELTSTTPEVQP